MALPKLKKPKVPAWKKPIVNVKPKLPKSGHYAPSIYNPSGRNQAYTGPKYQNPMATSTSPHIPPATTVPGAPNIPSYSGPDYGSIIGGDWEVQDAEAAHASQMARARGDFQAGLRSHLIDLGLSDTAQLGSLGQYIDNDTIKKAVENKYSTTAQIAQGAERSRAGNNASLAARGILSSGQTTKTQQDVTAEAESQRYGALRSFLEGGASGLGGLADLEYQGARSIAQARQAAAMRAAEFAAYGTEPVGGDEYTSQASSARSALGIPNRTRPALLGQKAWMAKHPGGKYANYVRAYRRQYGR